MVVVALTMKDRLLCFGECLLFILHELDISFFILFLVKSEKKLNYMYNNTDREKTTTMQPFVIGNFKI